MKGAAKMIKTFLYVALFFAFASCRGYRTAEGRVKPVYFTADPEIFKDTIYPPRQFWYRSLQGLQGNGIEQLELRDGDITKAFIQKPTFFEDGYNIALLYPGEKVHVGGVYNNGNYRFYIVHGRSRRNRELEFFQTFPKLEKRPPAIPNLHNYSLQSILDSEKEQKEAIAKAESASQAVFDSLLKAYNVRKKFKQVTREYIQISMI